jgi:hypothetical protein
MTGHLAGPPSGWEYLLPAPRGVKITLLTIGNMQVTGVWQAGMYKAWCLLIERDKELERKLGYIT